MIDGTVAHATVSVEERRCDRRFEVEGEGILSATMKTGAPMAKTVHVYKDKSGWAVRREGQRSSNVVSTQREAIEIARSIARDSAPSQMIVHDRDGTIRDHVTHGLPKVHNPPVKRGSYRKIEKAAGKVALERITSDDHRHRD